MTTLTLELDDRLAAVLHETNVSLEHGALELMVLELYRRGTVSSGWAAERLGMPRVNFIKHAGRLGIPYFDMTKEEWDAEMKLIESCCSGKTSLVASS